MKMYVVGLIMTIVGFSGMSTSELESPIAMLWIVMFSVGFGMIFKSIKWR